MDETKLTARLPNLEVEIIRREDAAQNAEMLTLNFRAVPSFEAFGRYLLGSAPEAAPAAESNPFGLWLNLWQQAWAPWLEVAKAMREKAETKAPPAPVAELADGASAAGDQEPKYAAG
jgi:hypothetical protein